MTFEEQEKEKAEMFDAFRQKHINHEDTKIYQLDGKEVYVNTTLKSIIGKTQISPVDFTILCFKLQKEFPELNDIFKPNTE